MKCFILLSLATLSLGAVVPFQGGFQHLLHGGYDPEHVYGQVPYGHISPTPFVHPQFIGQPEHTVHEQVVEEHPIAHIGDHQVAEQVVVKDYGLGHSVSSINPHEKVVAEHPIGQIGGHHLVDQVVVQDPVAVASHFGVHGGFVGQYSPYTHTQYPYGVLKAIYGNDFYGHYSPLISHAGVFGHYNPAVHHYY